MARGEGAMNSSPDLDPLHTDRWVTLTADEKADALRMRLLTQEVLIRSLLGAVRQLGVRFVGLDDDLEDDE